MNKYLSNRRDFIKHIGAVSASFSLFPSALLGDQKSNNEQPYIVKVTNASPKELVEKAVEPLGGMSAFVKKDQVVVVKPNMSWDRRPEQGATTNPEVVVTLINMALEAGAKEVRVFDRTCNEARRCYKRSGVAEAAEKAGAKVYHVMDRRFKNVKIPDGKRIRRWEVYRDLLDADVLINVPILKHHGLTRISIGLKNLMGFLGGDRGTLHRHYDDKIVDIASVIKPDLTVIDATRVLMRNGPQGGNLDDIEKMDTVLAGTDMVAMDAFAASLMGVSSQKLGYLVEAKRRGMGIIDIDKMKINNIDLS